MKASKVILYHGVKIDENNVTNLNPTNLMTELVSYKVAEYNDLNLVLENFTLCVNEKFYSIYDVNYMAFQNYGYSSKWFFAFVDKVEYISDSVCEIKFRIDYWSTYYSNLTFLKCFVEREITASDNIGEHTIDENLAVERVEQIERHTETIQSGLDTMFWIGMFTDYDAEEDKVTPANITVYNSGFSGHNLVLFQILLDDEIPAGETTSPLADSIKNIFYYILKANTSTNGSIADIKDLFILPYSIVDQSTLVPHYFSVVDETGTYYSMNQTLGANITDISFAKKSTFSDFSPLNNKLYCYPYNYMIVSNNVGNQNILKYEDFAGTTVTMQIQKAISIGCSIRIVPTNYKGQTIDYDEQISCAKFPVCGWSSDSYINWLTQNALNLTSQIIGIAGQAIGATETFIGSAMFEAEGYEVNEMGLGGLANTAQNVLNLMGQFRKANLMPNIEGGSQNNGDVGFASDSNNFEIKMMRVRLENLKSLDDYFTKFGYKINRVKIPNLTTSRFNHFYIKIGQGEKAITGNVPQEGLNNIENKLYNGLTVWKSIANIGNYESGTVPSNT